MEGTQAEMRSIEMEEMGAAAAAAAAPSAADGAAAAPPVFVDAAEDVVGSRSQHGTDGSDFGSDDGGWFADGLGADTASVESADWLGSPFDDDGSPFSGSSEEVFAPPPLAAAAEATTLVVAAPGGAAAAAPRRAVAPAARKRQRAAAEEASSVSTLSDLQWIKTVPPQLGYLHTGVLHEPVDFELAAILLRDRAQPLQGARPDFLEGNVEDLHGALFKDELSARRRNGTDKYSFKGGTSNIKDSTASFASTTTGAKLHVRRSYGDVTCYRMGGPHGAHKLRVHQLYFVLFDQDGTRRDLSPRIFHIQPVDNPAKLSVIGAVDVPSRNSITGTLSLTNATAQSPWAQFFAADRPGHVVGALVPSNGGVKLIGGSSGDFAEWHRRRDNEPPFERGDVVAVSELGLTRETKGAAQLGIVSRQALVEGSIPLDDEDTRSGDTIAYTGRVMVRLRGACNAGDHLVPSGFEDGTAMASSTTRPSASVGRALVSSALSGEETSLIECGVISPPSTVRNRSRRPIQAFLAIACLIVAVLFAIVWFSRQPRSNLCASCTASECPRMKAACQCPNGTGACPSCFGFESAPTLPTVSLGSRVKIPCPPSHTGLVAGVCRDVGVWEYSTSDCVRKMCPRTVLRQGGYQLARQQEILCFENQVCKNSLEKHTVVFPRVHESTGNVTIPCPTNYRGHLSMTCAPMRSEWSDLQGQCRWNHCEASREIVNVAGSKRYWVQLPALTEGDSISVSCCSRFSPSGGCSDPSDNIGSISATCSGARFVVTGQCAPPQDFGLGLRTFTVAGADSGSAGKNILAAQYEILLRAVGVRVSAATGNAWRMPKAGMLGNLALRRANEWRSISARNNYARAHYSFETHSTSSSQGRSAAAVANVACRQLGSAGAAVVTTCAGLKLLLRTAYRATSADAAGLLEAVCPSKGSGKYWAEISTTTDEPTPESDVPTEIKHRGWEWRQGGFFYGQPPWIPVHKSSCLGEEAAIDPIGIENSNSTCGWSAANAHGVCGNAGAVALCLQHALSQPVNENARSSSTNSANLVVACGDTDASGTWVVGDDAGTYQHDDAGAPKVFSATAPRFCRDEITEFWSMNATTCWGQLIDVEDAHRYYKFYTEKDVIDPAFQLSDSALWGPDGLAPWQPGETTENRRQ